MSKKCLNLIALFCFCSVLMARPGQSSSDILQSLHKLNTLASVLYIAAHPDDENTRLLTYLARERKYQTTYLSLTRGDGGQNLIGSEQGDLLGLIRTEELLAARRIDGAEQWFTRAVDFGYSKNPEETFRFWNRDSVLADVVYAIRRFRPEVVICRFPTTGEGGHGHHTASAILAEQAFDMAGDPTKFPEQLRYVSVWQAERLFWNTFNFGTTNTTAPDQLKLDVGGYNPLLGESYGEIAALSRSCHKSQGFGSAMQRGSQIEYFKQLRGKPVSKDLFEGINTDWRRMPGGASVSRQIKRIIKDFSSEHPEKSLDLLGKLYKVMAEAHGGNGNAFLWVKQKTIELEHIMLACAGIFVETTAKSFVAIPGKPLELSTQVIMRNPANAALKWVSYEQTDTQCMSVLKQNQAFLFKRRIVLSAALDYSSPHWLNAEGAAKYQTIKGQPANTPSLWSAYAFKLGGIDFVLSQEVRYKYTDPVKGELYRPVEILPPATVTPTEKTFVCKSGDTASLFFLVKANTDHVKGGLALMADKTCQIRILKPDFELQKTGDEVLIEARIRIMDPDYQGVLHAALVIDGVSHAYSIERVAYDHVPYRFVLSHARVQLRRFDLQTKGKRIGYIPGAGDDVAACLRQIGYQVENLSDEQIKNGNLSAYDAIVCGVRAYNTNNALPLYHKQLMAYVEQGGRFIVQYNTNSRVGPVQSSIGPYKFTISRNRVTDERADIRFLDDTSAILRFPNKISQTDFQGWVQERGVYFAAETDSAYRFVFGMSDPGEAEQNGSLIWTPYGKGVFVYTGLSFFRQLPAGVPGAYRLFVNLLSMPVQKP